MSKCTGLIFKARTNNYISNGYSFNHKESLTLLKRKSCQCEMCKAVLETIIEVEVCNIDTTHWHMLFDKPMSENFKDEYRMVVTSMDEYSFEYHFDPVTSKWSLYDGRK